MRRALFTALFIIAIADASTFAAQSPELNDLFKRLGDKLRTCQTLGKDLYEMAKVRAGSAEGERASNLGHATVDALYVFQEAHLVVFMYSVITDGRIKAEIRPILDELLNLLDGRIQLSLNDVNRDLSYVTSAGIAATATRLRDELRDGQFLLKALKESIPPDHK